MNTLIITTQWGRWAQLTPLTSLTVLTANSRVVRGRARSEP